MKEDDFHSRERKEGESMCSSIADKVLMDYNEVVLYEKRKAHMGFPFPSQKERRIRWQKPEETRRGSS